MSKSERTIRYLRIQAMFSTAALAALLLIAATPKHPRFAEIDVERAARIEFLNAEGEVVKNITAADATESAPRH